MRERERGNKIQTERELEDGRIKCLFTGGDRQINGDIEIQKNGEQRKENRIVRMQEKTKKTKK